MVAPQAEKAYEKYAWTLLFVIGILGLIFAIPLLLGIDPDPTGEERVIGMTVSQLKASNPGFFNFYTLYVRLGGLFFLAIALPTSVISATAYRRGEKWAWYASWNLPVILVGLIAVYLTVESFSSDVGAFSFFLVFLIISLMGLFLPYRKFFPKK